MPPHERSPRGGIDITGTPFPVDELQLNDSEDIVPPENFVRAQLDRHIHGINQQFIAGYGIAKTPIQSAIDASAQYGRVALLDVGCGTGRALKTWGDEVSRRAASSPDNIGLTGISLHDYRGESVYSDVTQAHLQKRIRYITGDAARMDLIADNSQDVTLAFATLVHHRDPLPIVKSMIRVTKPGGAIYFDISEKQSVSPLTDFLHKKFKSGWDIAVRPAYVKTPSGASAIRSFCRVIKQAA